MVIHSLDQGRAVLAKGAPVVLESPPGAAGQQGIGWWLALTRILKDEFPDADFEAVLDCADAPGLALAAISAGVPAIRVHGLSPDMTERLRAIARQTGSVIR